MVKHLTFIRHVESIANAGGITMPNYLIPLSEAGHQQARALAARLEIRPSCVLVSGLLRTQQTAAPFCERHGAHPQIDQDLNEFSVIDPGLIEGLDGAQRRPFTQAYWDDPDPDRRLGERADTFAEFAERVSRFAAAMDVLPDATVIFGHGIWFSMMRWQLSGHDARDPDDMRRFRQFQLAAPMPNCSVFRLTRAGGAWMVLKA